MKSLFVLLILIIITILSCGKIECGNPAIEMRLSENDSLSISMIIIRKYEKGNSFSNILSTSITGYGINTSSGDTIPLHDFYVGTINEKYDWIISLPVLNKEYRIRDITYENKSESYGIGGVHDLCANDISFYINDSLYHVHGKSTDGNALDNVIIKLQ